jgi:hypothetical protein
MQYIKQESFGSPVMEQMSLSRSAVRSRRGPTSGAHSSLTAAVTFEAVVPAVVRVDSTTPTCAHLVRLGLRINPPPNAAIEWMRFVVRVAPPADIQRQDETPQILSVYPARIDRPIVVHGRIGLNDSGEIAREQTAVPGADEERATYRPHVLGLRTAPDEAVWMWLPALRTQPAGPGELFMSVSGADNGSLRFTRSLNVAVRYGFDDECVYLEQKAESTVRVTAQGN